MARILTTEISDNECIGDSLATINTNFVNLDTGVVAVSAQNIILKVNYNSLIRSLSGLGAPGTNYNSLSSTFISLSSLVVP